MGQNVAITWYLQHEPPNQGTTEFPRLINAWFDEVRAFNPRDINPFKFKKKLGHYTQVGLN